MPSAERAHRPRQQSACMAGCWILLSTVAVAVAVALSLPAGWQYEPGAARDVFRPEWLVLTTLAVFPIHRASRACWWALLPAVGLPLLQVAFAVESAGLRLAATGFGDGSVVAWWLLPAVQLPLFVAAGLTGALGSLRDRRWERFMRRRLGPHAGSIESASDLAA